MEAIRLDIVVDQTGEARRVLDDLEIHYLKTGKSAGDAAKEVEKFENAYKDTRAKTEAKKQLDALAKGHDAAGEAARDHARKMSDLSATVMRFAGPAVVIAAAKNTLAWADSIQELAERTKFSVTAVQQMGKVAEQNGSSFQALAGAVQQAEQRLVDGNKKALDAVATMGLSVEALLSSKPEDRLRMLAVGLAEIEDPARRSAAEMAIFGRTGDALAPTLDKIAEGADRAKFALGADFIKTGADAQDMLDDMTDSVLDQVRAFLLLPAAITTAAGEWAKNSTLGTMFESMGFHGSRATPMPKLPGTPTGAGAFMPSPLPAGGDPFAAGGVGGNSLSFIERALGIRIPRGRAAKPEPWEYVPPGLSMPVHWGLPGIGPGRGGFPGWATPMDPIRNSMSRDLLGIGFGRTSQPVGYSSASMVSPASLLGGGGGLWKQIQGFLGGRGGQVAGGLMGLLGGLIPGMSQKGQGIGSLIGSFIPGLGPIGGMLGGLIGGGLGKLFGGGQHRKVNDMRDDFTAQYGGTQALAELAQKSGTNLDAFFKAKNVKDYEKAVQDLTKSFDKLGEKEAEIASLNEEMKSLTEQTTVGFDEMNAIVQEFGLDVSKMGQAFQQAGMDKEAKRIIDAFAVMEKGGADMNGVLDGMKDEISALVQQSIQFGTTIPSNMRPWIEELSKSGRLTDENGDAITDLSRIKFADPIVSEMEKLINKLDELIAKLGGMKDGWLDSAAAANEYEDAANRAPKPPGGDDPQGGDHGYNVSRGGIVGRGKMHYFNRGGFVPRGTDIVPAMLTPGEMVTSAGATRAILQALKERKSSGGDVAIVMIDGRANNAEIVDQVFRAMPRMVAGNAHNTRVALSKVLRAN